MVAATKLGEVTGRPEMPHVADWLQRLGLGQYTQRFVENDINFSILPDLTDQDLKELGVASLGHRRKLLRAIADLEAIRNSAPPVAVAAGAPAAPRPGPSAHGRVLRPRRLDRTLGSPRPRGPAGDRWRIPPLLHRSHHRGR